MITFDVFPNTHLKETLPQKMAGFMLRTAQVPVYAIGDKEEKEVFLEEVVKRGNSEKVINEVLRNVREAYLPHKNDYLYYFKYHLGRKETFQMGFTLYLYHIERDEYISVQRRLPSNIPLDKHFFKMLEKPIKNTKIKSVISLMIHDIVADMGAIAMFSEDYDIITQEEWQKEYEGQR